MSFLHQIYIIAFYYNIIVLYLLYHWSFICNFNICVLTGRKDSTLMKWWQLILLKSSDYSWCSWSSFSWSFSLSLSPLLSLSPPIFSSSSLFLPLSIYFVGHVQSAFFQIPLAVLSPVQTIKTCHWKLHLEKSDGQLRSIKKTLNDILLYLKISVLPSHHQRLTAKDTWKESLNEISIFTNSFPQISGNPELRL